MPIATTAVLATTAPSLAAAAAIALGRRKAPLQLASLAVTATALAAAGLVAAWAAGVPMEGRWLAVDGLSSVMLLLVAALGAVVARFSERSMRADPRQGSYARKLLAAIAALMLVVTATDVVALAAAWVATGLLLAALIGHADDAEARAAEARARRAFLVGDGALVAGLALLATAAGTTSIPAIAAAASTLPPGILLPATALMLVGALARSAALPFSGWLLSSLTAPTPVSAFMHAGLVNAGGFLIVRFSGVYAAAPEVLWLALAIGTVSAVAGTAIMLVQTDVKRQLAASTVAQMGFMMLQCGLGAFTAAVWHLVAHGLFKAWLFLSAGSAARTLPARVPAGAGGAAVGAAAVAGVLAALMIAGGLMSASSVLLVALASVAAVHALAVTLGSRAALPDRTALVALVAMVIGVQFAGLALVKSALGGVAAPVAGPGALVEVALVLLFVGLWLVQARGLRLPAGLYVRLLNAGRPVPAAA